MIGEGLGGLGEELQFCSNLEEMNELRCCLRESDTSNGHLAAREGRTS